MGKLAQYLSASGMTQKSFADAVKVSQPTVNRWLAGARPSWEKAAEIEKLTKGAVPLNSWVDASSSEAS